jgi:hypothetical protein
MIVGEEDFFRWRVPALTIISSGVPPRAAEGQERPYELDDAAKPADEPRDLAAGHLSGSVLEGIPAILLFGSLLSPIARQIGVHEVHYAMVVVLAMDIDLFAPPFGVGTMPPVQSAASIQMRISIRSWDTSWRSFPACSSSPPCLGSRSASCISSALRSRMRQ